MTRRGESRRPGEERLMFQWTADYAVGVRQIDEEHQRLFVLAERMHQAMLEGKGKAIPEELLARLVDSRFAITSHMKSS
jgi:hemerythrin